MLKRKRNICILLWLPCIVRERRKGKGQRFYDYISKSSGKQKEKKHEIDKKLFSHTSTVIESFQPKRGSGSLIVFRPALQFLPTYRLEPKKRFDSVKVKEIMQEIMDSKLFEVEYNETVMPDMCLNLSFAIKNAVKQEHFDRYRLVVVVTIGQKRQQSVHIAHCFLWDPERDRYANYFYETSQFYAQATVYGIYMD